MCHVRRLYGKPCVQMMSDLPKERIEPGKPPFTYVGVDVFGPFHVKVKRTVVKRYGCLFTCMVLRAIHIEVLMSLDTDSYLNAFRRFVARRGMPEKVFSDNGTNFVGGDAELRRSLSQLSKNDIVAYGQRVGVEWHFNPPHASHMGGAWERLILCVRRVMCGLLGGNVRLDDEILATVFCETEAIVNGRPLTKLSDDIDDPLPLTPNHLLLLRCKIPSIFLYDFKRPSPL